MFDLTTLKSKFGKVLAIVPTAILGLVALLQNNGVDLGNSYEGIIAVCVLLATGGAVTQTAQGKNETDLHDNTNIDSQDNAVNDIDVNLQDKTDMVNDIDASLKNINIDVSADVENVIYTKSQNSSAKNKRSSRRS